MIKRVNAGLKSKSDLYKKLFEGEVFYTHQGGKLYYSELYSIRGETPFRFDDTYLAGVATMYKALLSEVDVEWYEDITKPVLCWVSDINPTAKRHTTLVISYDKELQYSFTSLNDTWKHATPVTPDDLLQ